MTIWDGGYPDQSEPERETQHAWEDPLDGEMPGQPPRRVDDPEEWKFPDWPENLAGPEYWLYKRDVEDS